MPRPTFRALARETDAILQDQANLCTVWRNVERETRILLLPDGKWIASGLLGELPVPYDPRMSTIQFVAWLGRNGFVQVKG